MKILSIAILLFIGSAVNKLSAQTLTIINTTGKYIFINTSYDNTSGGCGTSATFANPVVMPFATANYGFPPLAGPWAGTTPTSGGSFNSVTFSDFNPSVSCTPGTSPGSCVADIAIVGETSCGYSNSNCFDVSTAALSCTTGLTLGTVNASWSSVGSNVTVTLY